MAHTCTYIHGTYMYVHVYTWHIHVCIYMAHTCTYIHGTYMYVHVYTWHVHVCIYMARTCTNIHGTYMARIYMAHTCMYIHGTYMYIHIYMARTWHVYTWHWVVCGGRISSYILGPIRPPCHDLMHQIYDFSE